MEQMNSLVVEPATKPYLANRCAELFAARGMKHMVLNGTLWYRDREMVKPWGPASEEYQLHPEACREVLRELGGQMILMTDGFSSGADADGVSSETDGGWYAVICDKFTSMDQMSAKHRSEVKRGFRNCEVRRIDAQTTALEGYQTMAEACKSYGGPVPTVPPQAVWEEKIARNQAYADIMHYWGVYHKDKLVAFAENYVLGKTEVSYSSIKLHPDYLSLYPSYALIHKMNEHYLGSGYQYVNDGWRSIYHQTHIQHFLITKFGFRKAYANLRVHYRPLVHSLAVAGYPFRRILKKLDLRLGALFSLEQCRRASAEA
jgi:hypothetical protein